MTNDAMGKIVFSTDQFSGHLDDGQRYAHWRDLYAAQYGLLDFTRADSRPFSAHLEFAQFGPVAAGRFEGALARARRAQHELRRDAREEFFLFFNSGRSPILVEQCGREAPVQPGMAALLSYSEPGDCRSGDDHAWLAFTLLQDRLRHLVRHVEDLLAVPLDPESEAMRYLRSYADFLHGPGSAGDPALADHIGQMLLDLIALAIGTSRDDTEIARARGLRAARLRAVLAEIEAGFADPGFSPGVVAKRLRLSPRYVQDLLQDTGASFVERVSELRLQKARRMLADRRRDETTVADIAYACGFGEVPYFNRCFRKRFGASPSAFRSSAR